MITSKGGLKKIINFWLIPFIAGGCFSTGYLFSQKVYNSLNNENKPASNRNSTKNPFPNPIRRDLQSVQESEIVKKTIGNFENEVEVRNIKKIATPSINQKVEENIHQRSNSNTYDAQVNNQQKVSKQTSQKIPILSKLKQSDENILKELFQTLPKP